MKFSEQKFKQLLEKNELIICLIGMSNMGKTYWSKQFSNINFKHISCDDRIEEKLAPELKALGYSGIADVSRWMGQPYEERFSANQQKYLEFEKEVMKEIFTELKNAGAGNIVIDTTGSFVHTGSDICSRLQEHALMLYIEATENMKEEMFQRYIKEPKPVVFGDVFAPKKGEESQQTLKRCYPQLLDLRSALYTRYADVIIPRETISNAMDIHQFIAFIQKLL